MSLRVPIHVQPISEKTQFLPSHFNSSEYDTLSSLNLPMNENGWVSPQSCARIPLGYRILLPRGYIGVIKERRSVIEKTPFIVLAGILDCNAVREDSELESKQTNWPSELVQTDVLSKNTIVRMHPEVVLYLFNCGQETLTYSKGKSIVQLFVKPACENQIQILQSNDFVSPPLRYSEPDPVLKTV